MKFRINWVCNTYGYSIIEAKNVNEAEYKFYEGENIEYLSERQEDYEIKSTIKEG